VTNMIKKALRAGINLRRRALERACADDVRGVLNGQAIELLDVGASGGIIPRWRPYREDLSFTGVEPDARSIPALVNSPEAKVFRGYEIIPFGAWSRNGPVNISFTRKPMCSSHFMPNREFLSRFPQIERFDVVASNEVDCRTVDDLLASAGKSVDFIKLDLEGGELAVLEGATKTLQMCTGLHVEVCFQSIREGQPLFADVQRFLGSRGIEFVDFVALMRWERRSFSGPGQAIFADALFLRSPENLLSIPSGGILSAAKARVYLAILLIYERYDLAEKFLELLNERNVALSQSENAACMLVVKRRKASFDRRFRLVAMLGRMFSRFAGDNYGLHIIY